jgi:hypothetical protein
MNSPAYLATIDEHRRVWGLYNKGVCSFFIIKGEKVMDFHLTLEAVEALRLVIEKLQNEMTTLGYMKISTGTYSPVKKTPLTAKKAGKKRKTKRPSLAKKKK